MLPDGEERVLHGVLGRDRVAKNMKGNRESAHPEALMERRECLVVAASDRREQCVIGKEIRSQGRRPTCHRER